MTDRKAKMVKMPRVRFHANDGAVMEREGWASMVSDSRGNEIEKDDAEGAFFGDDDALAHVMRRALADKPSVYVKALVDHIQGREAWIDELIENREKAAKAMEAWIEGSDRRSLRSILEILRGEEQ